MENIHKLRKREFELFSDILKNYHSKSILELGCGDGFQSLLFTQYFDLVVATDFNEKRFIKRSNKIKFLKVDAEELKHEYLKEKSFDVIFSSNLLEHIPKIDQSLQNQKNLIKKGGLFIHIMPNTLWRFLTLILFYPQRLRQLAKKILKKNVKSKSFDNNLKSKKDNTYLKIFFPMPHGAYSNTIKELYFFSRYRWKKVFKKNNFELIEIRKGPVSTGYYFGFHKLKKILFKIGITTEYIYILRK